MDNVNVASIITVVNIDSVHVILMNYTVPYSVFTANCGKVMGNSTAVYQVI